MAELFIHENLLTEHWILQDKTMLCGDKTTVYLPDVTDYEIYYIILH